MKNLKLLVVALVAMFGFIACDKHECNDYDHSADIVGTWTCLQKDFAEALVIKADGSVVSTGVAFGEYWENVKGNIVVENGNATMTFEDHDNYKGHFDIIPGMAFSIYNDEGVRFTYNYCSNDLTDELVGMWVCNDGLTDGVTIMSYSNNGKVTMTTATALGTSDALVNHECDYVVVGDLVFMELPASNVEGQPMYTAARMTYTPDATSAGDIMTHKKYATFGGSLKESVMSFLRINQHLDLEGNKYDYIKTFVTNVKGLDKDIDFMGYTFNFAKMDGSGLDKMLKALLFAVEFPDANTLGYSYQMNGNKETYNSPIVVEGNKMTIKMSDKVATLKDVVLYAFQDADCSQIHFYTVSYTHLTLPTN